MPGFGRRVAEIVLFEIIISALFTFVIQVIGATDILFIIFMVLCLSANMIFMFVCLRNYLFSVPLVFYFKVNITAYLLLAIINILMAYFNFEPFYTYMFFPYKLFMQLGLTKMVSAFIVNFLFIAEICIMPII